MANFLDIDRNIIVDCDMTVCDLSESWMLWLQEVTGVEKDPHSLENYKLVQYDLAYYWKDELKHEGIDGLDFWRQKGIYDSIEPLPWSQDVLSLLSEKGYNIIFVSSLKGNHHKSKVNFLKEYFPFMKGFFGTREKYLLSPMVCAIIDDRNSFLEGMGDSVKLIRKTTSFTQEVELTRPCLDYSWTQGIHKLVEYIES